VYTAWWWADIFLWTEKSVKIFASDYYIVKEQYIKSSMCYNLLCFENHVPSTLKTVTLYVEAQNTFKTNIFHLSKLIILVKPMRHQQNPDRNGSERIDKTRIGTDWQNPDRNGLTKPGSERIDKNLKWLV
jgi:hypothetical protein